MLAGLCTRPAFAVYEEPVLEAETASVEVASSDEAPPMDEGLIIEELPAVEEGETQAQAAAPPDAAKLKALISQISAYQLSTVKNPTLAVAHGEWTVLSLARAGSITKEFKQTYLANLYAALDEKGGVLSKTQYTEYSRVVLALSAIGEDPSAANGYDLLLPLADFDSVVKQGVNGAAWALLALDAKKYDVPKSTFKNKTTREKLISHIVKNQLADGGFSLLTNAASGDADLTGMAITALAPYRFQNGAVSRAIDRALTFLGSKQFKNGGWGLCESTAQVITALSALGIAPDDPRFVKEGALPYDGLMRFYIEDGSFAHTAGSSANPIATDQAMYALVAMRRSLTGMPPLFDMTDSAPAPDSGVKDVTDAIDALPQNPGIAAKGRVTLLISRLEKLADFPGKAAYQKKLAAMKSAIEATEAHVKRLDEDIWNKLDPKNITIADSETISALMSTYESLKEADRAYVKNAQSLLVAKSIVDALSRGVIPAKVFENIRGSEQTYSYGGAGYTLSFKGTDVTAPADMAAGVKAGSPSPLPALKNAYWVSLAEADALPTTVNVSVGVEVADGSYALYRYASGRLERAGSVAVSGGVLSLSTSRGGDFALVSSAKPPTLRVGKTRDGKADKLEKSIFEQIKGQDVNILIEGETDAGYAYRLTFNGENISAATPFDPQINTGGANASFINLLAEDAFIMDFAHEGELPGKMLVEIETPLADGEYLLFYFDEAEQRALPEQKVTVTDGWASFFMEHCSDWFIAARAKKASVSELLNAEAAPAIAQIETPTAPPPPPAPSAPAIAAPPPAAPRQSGGNTAAIICTLAAAAFITAAALIYRKKRKASKSEA